MPEPIDHDRTYLAPPVEDTLVPLPPGLRDLRLTDRAANKIKTLLDDADQPTYAGQEMPTADAAVLLEQTRALLVEGLNSGKAVEIDDAFWQERRRALQKRIAARQQPEKP